MRVRTALLCSLLALGAAAAPDDKPASSWLPAPAKDAKDPASKDAPAPAKAGPPAAKPAAAPGAAATKGGAPANAPAAAATAPATSKPGVPPTTAPPASKPGVPATAPPAPAATSGKPGAPAAAPASPAATSATGAAPAATKSQAAPGGAPAAAPAAAAPAGMAMSSESELSAPARVLNAQELYDEALSAHAKGDSRKAAGLFFRWLRDAARTAETYDSAQHLLAEDLARLGLIHAALIYESTVVQTRARPELVAVALSNLEAWTRDTPHDETRLEEELLHGTDFGFLEGPSRAYVLFHQGALDLKLGSDRWAEARFAELPKGSPWRARARLLAAATRLARRGPDAPDQLGEFEEVAADVRAPREVRNEAHVEAARLRFEAGEFDAALDHYHAVDLPELDAGRGQIYLEEAWAHYRKGEGGRAMGLLAALDAPSFRALFLPEKFQLRALIFKDACHWLPAKRAARGLLRRYKPALEAIRERQDLTQEPLLAEAALQKGSGARADRLVKQLRHEREELVRYAGSWSESGLQQRLESLYAPALAEADRRRQLELERGALRVADELLGAVEQVNLVDYEVGLALYRRQRGNQASTLTFADALPKTNEVGFAFDGEYWNDELQSLRFALVDRCAEGVAP